MERKGLIRLLIVCALIHVVNLSILSRVISAEEQVITLHTEAQDTAPKWILDTRGETPKIVGLCADILRMVEQESERLQFRWEHKFVPIRRTMKHLASGKIDLAVGYSYTPQRAEQYLISQTSLYEINHVLVVREDDPVQVASFEELASLDKQGKVLTLFGGGTADYLKQHSGLVIDDYAKSPEILLERLLKGRGRFVYYYDYSLIYTIARESLQDCFRILPHSFKTYSHYIVYSPHLSREIINEIERILKDLKARGELARIYRKYMLLY